MMVKANAKYIRVSPRKTRLVANLVRGLNLTEALAKLAVVNKRASTPVAKLLQSALANAKHNFDLDESNLYIKEIHVENGPVFRRWMPKAFGRATPIQKKTSHIFLALDERVPSKKKTKEKVKKEIETVKVENIKNKVAAENIDTKKAKIAEENTEEQGESAYDKKRKVGYRSVDQNQKEKIAKKSKGILKKLFNRKSGM